MDRTNLVEQYWTGYKHVIEYCVPSKQLASTGFSIHKSCFIDRVSIDCYFVTHTIKHNFLDDFEWMHLMVAVFFL